MSGVVAEVGIGGWLRPPELVVTAAVHGQVNEPDDEVGAELRPHMKGADLIKQGAPRRQWDRP